MDKVQIKIRVEGDVPLPEYKTPDSAGCDLVSNEDGAVTIYPHERAFFRTGVYIQLPEGYEAQVRGRSGLNRNNGIICPTGTIDADYRGEIGVILHNLGIFPYTIHPGDRIAQLVICPYIQAEWQQVESLDESQRGEGGFGSTGK